MSTPAGSISYREIPSIRLRSQEQSNEVRPSEEEIIAEHINSGWVLDKGSEEELIFSSRLADGRKWTRHYDRKSRQYMCQRFYELEVAVKSEDWPPVHFGD